MVNMGFSELFWPTLIPYLAYSIPALGLIGSFLFFYDSKKISWAKVLFPLLYVMFYGIYNQIILNKFGSVEACACSFLVTYFDFFTNQVVSAALLVLFLLYYFRERARGFKIKS
jgi:fatty-acid desaturase